jgi:hypothetical protein
MRLSEAIRLGAMLKPQGFGATVMRSRHVETSCTLRAACDALGVDVSEYPYGEMAARYPFLRGLPCPACGGTDGGHTGVYVVFHLNDVHKWTRERIADWVATVEPQSGPESEPAHVSAV